MNILYQERQVDGLHAPPLKADTTVEEAINQLLYGTHLKVNKIDANTISIVPMSQASEKTPISDAIQRPTPVRLAAAREVGVERTAADDRNQKSLAEVVVTAQKREERLLDVPVSVEVLSPDNLSAQGALQLRDFADSIPGVSVATGGAGNSQVVMRGLTLGQNTDPLPSTVTYVDDVPYGSSVASGSFANFTSIDAGLFDMDRIEVLKGPQGTLYGADAMAGVVKYVTKMPSTESLKGQVQTGLASTRYGGLSYNTAAAVNVPLVDRELAFRASGWYSHDGGYIDNLALNQKDVNRSGIYGGRLDFLFTPNDRLSIRFGGFLQNISRDGSAYADFNSTGQPVDGSLDQRRLIAEPYEQHYRLASATVTYDLNWARLFSISSYQTTTQRINFDDSYLDPVYASFSEFYGFTNGLSSIAQRSYARSNKVTQEFRLSSESSGFLEWVVGGYYQHEAVNYQTGLFYFDVDGQQTGNANAAFNYSEPTTFEEFAPFGTLTWHVTSQFDASAGLRYSHSSETISQRFTDTAPYQTDRSSENALTYLANARYHFSDRAVAYLRYATGYRPGGPNFQRQDIATGSLVDQPPFKSDTLRTYELGFKYATADRRFGLEAAGFYYDWKDLQLYEFIPDGFSGYTNANGGARIFGAELALTAHPIQPLTLMGAFAFLDARLRQEEPALGAAKNERLPNTGPYSVNVSADYMFIAGDLSPTLGASLRIASNREAGFDGGTSIGVPQYNLPAYAALDLRAGLTLGKVNAQLYVRNLFDKRGELSAITYEVPYNAPALVSLIQPRTVGLTLSMHF